MVVEFGSNQLWIERVPRIRQAEIWLDYDAQARTSRKKSPPESSAVEMATGNGNRTPDGGDLPEAADARGGR